MFVHRRVEGLGARIKAARLKAGFSRNTVSYDLRVAYKTIGDWEKGITEPIPFNLIRLADLFNITTDSLLKGE